MIDPVASPSRQTRIQTVVKSVSSSLRRIRSRTGSLNAAFHSSPDEPHPPTPPLPNAPPPPPPSTIAASYQTFLARHPDYASTSALDELRRTDFKRLDDGQECYADWMGAAVFPEELVRAHSALLLDARHTFGNSHSGSASSRLSSSHTAAARRSVCAFFDAPPSQYCVIFTPNASGAIKLVGEAYPWAGAGARYVVPVDAHNSVHGVRAFAERGGAEVRYYGFVSGVGPDLTEMEEALRRTDGVEGPTLLAVTGLSNVSNAKAPLHEIVQLARNSNAHILFDAAALAPTSQISLRETPVDAMAVSFYKMFGYPTGVGALIVRRDFLRNVLKRPWFAGGTVDIVQVPGYGERSYAFHRSPTLAPDLEEYPFSDLDVEKFEDGTVNFLSIAAIPNGIELLTRYRHILPLRLSMLARWLYDELEALRYPDSRRGRMVQIVSVKPEVGRVAKAGATVSFVLLDSRGQPIRNDVVEDAARGHVALRAGCMCNPGAVLHMLHQSKLFANRQPGLLEVIENLHLLTSPGKDVISSELFGGDMAFGVMRASLGLATNFKDVWTIVQWVRRAAETLDMEALSPKKTSKRDHCAGTSCA